MNEQPANGTILETMGVTMDFGGLRAVDNASFRVKRGELMSIIGPNGAGKTTFFNLLSGHLTPTSGQVLFYGEDITGLSVHQRARLGLGRSFQLTNVFPELSAFENVRVAAQARKTTFRMWRPASSNQEINDKANHILERVGLIDKAGIRASSLAYGDQRYLEIGIALATDPVLVLLDEPTAGMSPEESRHTADFIKGLSQQVDIILVEHDMEVVMSISDEVTCMFEGGILACQAPADIRQNPDVQSCYFRE